MTPKYLEKLSSIVSSGLLVLNGNRLLVELLIEGEKKTASGIVVGLEKAPAHLSAADRARVAVVLAVGPGYELDDGTKVDMPYKPGDYVMLNQFGVKTFGEFFGLAEYKDGQIGLITDDLVQARISDFAKFEQILKQA
jgi:co-chaperonin GroES (HSP10)